MSFAKDQPIYCLSLPPQHCRLPLWTLWIDTPGLSSRICENSCASSIMSSVHMLTDNFHPAELWTPQWTPLDLPPGFMQDIFNVVITINVTTSGRRRLAEGPELVFYAT